MTDAQRLQEALGDGWRLEGKRRVRNGDWAGVLVPARREAIVFYQRDPGCWWSQRTCSGSGRLWRAQVCQDAAAWLVGRLKEDRRGQVEMFAGMRGGP